MLYRNLILLALFYSAEAPIQWRSQYPRAKSCTKSYDFHMRSNNELYEELLNDMDVAQRITIQRLRSLGHVVRIEDNAPATLVFDAAIYGSRLKARASLRWKVYCNHLLCAIIYCAKVRKKQISQTLHSFYFLFNSRLMSSAYK